MISSAVWIGADIGLALSVSNRRLSPIETDKVNSMSDTLHTSAYHTVGAVFSRQPISTSDTLHTSAYHTTGADFPDSPCFCSLFKQYRFSLHIPVLTDLRESPSYV